MTEPWYEPLILRLIQAQGENAERFRALAFDFRAMARLFEQIAATHVGLAESVPEGDQAAADLGTTATAHEIHNLQTVVRGEQELAQRTEQAQRTDHAALVRLEGKVELLAAQVAELVARLTPPAARP